jgi:phosphatidylglycerophosphatase A
MKSRWLLKMLVSLGVGLFPGPHGTYGSLLAAGIGALWIAKGGVLHGCGYAGVALLICAAAVYCSHLALRQRVFGDQADPGRIVIDEAAGMLVAMYGISSLGWELLAALALFRLFDITKPLGVNALQRLPGAWGVVADDLLAGLYAMLGWRALAWLMAQVGG